MNPLLLLLTHAAAADLAVEVTAKTLLIRDAAGTVIVEGHALDRPGTFALSASLDVRGTARFELDPAGRGGAGCESWALHWVGSAPDMPTFDRIEVRPDPSSVRDGSPPALTLTRTEGGKLRVVVDLDRDGVVDVEALTPFGWS